MHEHITNAASKFEIAWMFQDFHADSFTTKLFHKMHHNVLIKTHETGGY